MSDSLEDNATDNLDTKEEVTSVLWTGHPSYLGYLFYYVFGIIFIVLGSLHWFFAIWAHLMGAFSIVVAIFDRNNKVYAVTDAKIIARAHMHRYSDEMKIEEITGVSLHYGPVERLFGLGTVRIAGEVPAEEEEEGETTEIAFKGIKNARHIAVKIEELMGK